MEHDTGSKVLNAQMVKHPNLKCIFTMKGSFIKTFYKENMV